jgi:hypothetical protein
VKKLCGPDAIRLADPALQIAVADSLAEDLSVISFHDSLMEMFEEDQSFTGRLLNAVIRSL